MIENLEQGSPEWLAYRKNKIGASESSIILGISKWATPYQLWLRKLGLIPEVEINDAMKKGTHLEPIARELFEQTMGVKVTPIVKKHNIHDWMIASLDGYNEKEQIAVEIKCGGIKLYEDALNGVIPDYYMCQMQHQLEVTGLEFIFYFVYFQGCAIPIEVKRDNVFINKIIEAGKEFWNRLQNLEAPELTDKDYIERNDEAWIETVQNWKSCQMEKKRWEELEQRYRNSLIQLAGKMNCKGNGIKLSRIIRKGSVNYQKIPELQGVNLEPYRNSSIETFRVLECN